MIELLEFGLELLLELVLDVPAIGVIVFSLIVLCVIFRAIGIL
jgi:hypothetical protein